MVTDEQRDDGASGTVAEAIAAVGPRLRALRERKDLGLAAVARRTGISVSTLSRLESGGRRPTLELVLPLAEMYGTTLDDLVRSARPADPRVRRPQFAVGARLVQPLSWNRAGRSTYRIHVPGHDTRVELQRHEGHEWLFVLSGRLRLVIDEDDTVLEAGEAAEFSTLRGHWFGSTGDGPVDVISLFSSEGEKVHVRSYEDEDEDVAEGEDGDEERGGGAPEGAETAPAGGADRA